MQANFNALCVLACKKFSYRVLTVVAVSVPVLSKHTMSTLAKVLNLFGSSTSMFWFLRRTTPAPIAVTNTA